MFSKFDAGWRQVGISLLLLSAVTVISSVYSVIAVPLGREFHASRMTLMLAMTIMSGATALLAPVLGGVMDRTSLRGLMMLGGLLLAAGYGALSFAASFVQVLAIFGLILAPANVLMGPMAVTVLLSRWFAKRRGAAIGIAIAGISVGGVIFPPFVQWLLDAHPWRDAFRIFALFLLVYAVLPASFVINPNSHRPSRSDDDAEADNMASPAGGQPYSSRMIFANLNFWPVAAIFSIVLSGETGMLTNLAPLAIDVGVKVTNAAWLVSVYAACAFVAKVAFAGIADRLSLRTLMIVSLGGFGAGIACLTQAQIGYWVIATGVTMVGLFGGLMLPLQSLLVPRIFGENVAGRAMGLMNTATLFALLATPPLFGLIFDLTGSYRNVFLTFAILAAAGILVVPYIRLERGGGIPPGRPALDNAAHSIPLITREL